MHPVGFCPTFSICSANWIPPGASGSSEQEAAGRGLGNQPGAIPGGPTTPEQLSGHGSSWELLKKLALPYKAESVCPYRKLVSLSRLDSDIRKRSLSGCRLFVLLHAVINMVGAEGKASRDRFDT